MNSLQEDRAENRIDSARGEGVGATLYGVLEKPSALWRPLNCKRCEYGREGGSCDCLEEDTQTCRGAVSAKALGQEWALQVQGIARRSV